MEMEKKKKMEKFHFGGKEHTVCFFFLCVFFFVFLGFSGRRRDDILQEKFQSVLDPDFFFPTASVFRRYT